MDGAQAQVLTFKAGGRSFALPMSAVLEVVPRPPVSRVPGSPPVLAGLASHRGEVLPVLATAALAGVAESLAAGRRLIVLDAEPRLGLSVDEVTGLAAPQEGAGRGSLVLLEDGDARVLQIDEILRSAFSGHDRAAAPRNKPVRPDGGVREHTDDLAFLGVVLCGQNYAIPLADVAKVLALPDEIARLPKTDEAMAGVMNLRGRLLPVVSTAALLGLEGGAAGAGARVVVAVIGDAHVGLLVDGVTSITRAGQDRLGPVPKVLNRGAGEARIQAMLRAGQGGLVAVLSPERLFREESVAQILEDGRQGDNSMEAAEVGAGEKLLIFALGEERYALPLATVQEVVNLPSALTRVPNAPPFLAGVMNLRGQVIPVIDQRERFQAEARAGRHRRRVIVTRLDGMLCGFAVDAVSEILEAAKEDIAATPAIAADGATLFDRTVRTGKAGDVVLLVNPKALLDQAETELMRKLVADGGSKPA
jgi:purine-binding chemotaxis protein CheW